MRSSVKTSAEQRFAAAQKKNDQFLKQKEKNWQEMTDKTARLRALRLAKEAADNEAAEAAAAAAAEEKAAKKKKK